MHGVGTCATSEEPSQLEPPGLGKGIAPSPDLEGARYEA